ncbi:hypothetical protein, partial [Rhizobium laguerreae]|uniref:hypothetical protein n=1 Tax=Rhizobium laguerreae TaxID=1076926 RepID=UPI001C907FCA
TLTKIIGKRSRHSMLASTPASILNHKTSKNGIPADSTKSGYALKHETENRFSAKRLAVEETAWTAE